MSTYLILQHYWWFLISLIGGIFSFLLFVQGGQTLLFSLSKDESERILLVNALGRKWEYTFTTLVTFGGALFASFPLFYSTSFGGAYWVWMLILVCFVLQAVSYEYQSKPGNLFGRKIYRIFLLINGVLGTFLVGAAIGTFFTGSNFIVDKGNLTDTINPVISRWGTAWHGLEALADIRNWLLGFTVLFLARVIACLFFINRLDNEKLVQRSRKSLFCNAIPFVIFFLAFVISIFCSKGFAVDSSDNHIFMQAHKYFLNMIQMPLVGIVFIIGVLLVLYGIIKSICCTKFSSGVWFSGIGTVLTVGCLLLITGYNNTAYYPSYANLQSSLTIANSSSSEFTLKAMSFVSILVPFVLAYIVYAWNALERKRLNSKDFKEDGHTY